MSVRGEPRIRCPRCGRSVPAMIYCIYCGARLPTATPKVPAPTVPRVPEAPPAPPRVPPPVAAPPKPTPPPAPPTIPVGVRAEIRSLMSGISTYQDRKISLMNLFQGGEVSEKVFMKLYEEYGGKLSELLNQRVSRLEELRSQLEEKRQRLDEVRFNLEELEARHKVGEIDAQTFEERAARLRGEESRLKSEIEGLESNIEHLERIFSEKPPREILNMEGRVKTFYESLDRMVEEGRLSRESAEKLKPDLEEALKLFDSIIGERKERERKLREQLEALHARYRVSEISIEEYERRKREIQREIDKIWGL